MSQIHPEDLEKDRTSGLTATGVVIRSVPVQFVGVVINNVSASVRHVKIYDKATAPTNSDTPVYTRTVAAGTNDQLVIPNGVRFANGLSARCTTGAADNDNTGATAGDVLVTFHYKPEFD